jgi:hypothetical protein
MEDGLPSCSRKAPTSDPGLGGGEPLGGAHGVLPASAPAIRRLESALDNLALAASNDMAVLQQLTAANLALTSSVATLTATNKKLVDAATHRGGNPAATPAATPAGGRRPPMTRPPPHPGNYCWTHGHCNCKEHTSATCLRKAPGHRDEATAANTLGGSEKNKGWEARPT